MVDIVIVCDNQDEKLGSFFKDCLDDTFGFLQEQNLNQNLKIFDSTNCRLASLNSHLQTVGQCIFIAFSHGRSDSLVCNGEEYVFNTVNTHLFKDSFVYSIACLTAKNIGPTLIENNCSAFIGYDKAVNTLLNYKSIHLNCELSGLKAFISLNITVSEAYNKMVSYYNDTIDRQRNIDPFFAAELVNIKESLTVIVRKDITIDEFIIC